MFKIHLRSSAQIWDLFQNNITALGTAEWRVRKIQTSYVMIIVEAKECICQVYPIFIVIYIILPTFEYAWNFS